ncbi:MAG: hypothetical protein M3004_10985, partial [Bacteroidota bacterium]|nr:hypothetical protein [Bacteroidota bacterium]
MKSFCIILLGLASNLEFVFGQMSEIDSLNKLLAPTKQDTDRVLLLTELAAHYQFFNSDTSIILINESIELAKKLNYSIGETRALARLGEILHRNGKLPQALDAEMQALQLAHKNFDSAGEAQCLTFTALIYTDVGEYRQGLNYLFDAKNIYDNISHQLPAVGVSPQFPAFGLSNIGGIYEKMNMLDSALYFQKKALASPVPPSLNLRALILTRIGNIFSRLKNDSAALRYFREALLTTYTSGDLLNRSGSQYEIAEIFRLQQNIDSSLNYAQRAYINAQRASQKSVVLDASNLLTKLYMAKGNVDSAFYYQGIAINTKDSLFGIDKFQQLQRLTLSEQKRVQQLREEQANSRVRIQRIGLLSAVGVFLLIALLLWRINRQQQQANHVLKEKNSQIEAQTYTLEKTLGELKSSQAQLIQSEKMASLGELTAGIAHEIQNPLNFVNNFSEVNKELLDEMKAALANGNADDVREIADDVIQNLEKINHHGKRADA